MSDGPGDTTDARRELAYYKRRSDEVAAENLRLDVAVSALHHEIKQKREGFALLSTLQRSVGAHPPLPDVFRVTLREIATTMGMDRSVVLVPTDVSHLYRPRWWLGLHHEETAGHLSSLALEFPPDFATGVGRLLVNGSTPRTPLIESIRAAFDLPFFACVPMIAHGAPIGLLVSGRVKEMAPLWPPLDRGDLDTFEAVAGLISAQVELEHVERLRSFLSPSLANLIVRSGDETLLEHHRREIASVFCDLRGFTSFSEAEEPEIVMGVLQEYHAAMGELIERFQGTLEHIAGDGIFVFFNDPLPCPEPAKQAVCMAVAMRELVQRMESGWRKSGYDLGFGVGISLGFATLGKIGYQGRFHYAATGSVVNLAARLCADAKGGQILVSSRVSTSVEDIAILEPVGSLELKGFRRPIAAYNVVALKEANATPT